MRKLILQPKPMATLGSRLKDITVAIGIFNAKTPRAFPNSSLENQCGMTENALTTTNVPPIPRINLPISSQRKELAK